jgi:hypothetical protein
VTGHASCTVIMFHIRILRINYRGHFSNSERCGNVHIRVFINKPAASV